MWELSMGRLSDVHRKIGWEAICSLPYPMLLGRKPITMATMASIATIRMAAASISTNLSVAQSPNGPAALACVRRGSRDYVRTDPLARACSA